jgi:hypothetical protein
LLPFPLQFHFLREAIALSILQEGKTGDAKQSSGISDGKQASQWTTYLAIELDASDHTHFAVQHVIDWFHGVPLLEISRGSAEQKDQRRVEQTLPLVSVDNR